ncbi:Elongation factor [Thalictrum thalictroides]|uniref:Elongation factor n=1 Tax=Thalictrum thalictroides TaxID=46969 RepID=A0A7J6V074_THATH|nr:Elongation factor [Thalictrum thalictroides]
MMLPVTMRRVWVGFATRIGIRRSGLLKLSNDVKMCEYEDVHVMWEMLRKTEPEICRSRPQIKPPRRQILKPWVSRVPQLCRSF